MIAPAKVLEVERLLADGQLSQRSIAKLVRVSRATVAGIADGTRPDYAARQTLKDREEPQGPVIRCRTCGGRVYAPCRLCRVRRLKQIEAAKEKEEEQASAASCQADVPPAGS